MDLDMWQLRAIVEDRFFTALTDELAATADELALAIEADVKRALRTFFSSLASKLTGLTGPFPEITRYVGSDWIPLGFEYEKYRKYGQTDFFVYSELPIVRRRTHKSQSLKRSTIGLKRDRERSLRNQLAEITDFAKFYGDVIVTVESNTKINKGGRREYIAGTTRNGMRVGGQKISTKSDFLTIKVDWAPKLAGLDVLQRGVTEANLNPRVKRKLLNSQAQYRPLVGPYMLYYQNAVISLIIDRSLKANGGIL
jgi:hypothetical protein